MNQKKYENNNIGTSKKSTALFFVYTFIDRLRLQNRKFVPPNF